MSTPKKAVKPLPKTLTLTRSQAVSISALSKQIQNLNVALESSVKARAEVLQEIAKAHSVPVEAIEQNYRFDGEKLFRE